MADLRCRFCLKDKEIKIGPKRKRQCSTFQLKNCSSKKKYERKIVVNKCNKSNQVNKPVYYEIYYQQTIEITILLVSLEFRPS